MLGSNVNRSREALVDSPFLAERLPGFVNVLAKTSLRVRCRIGCNYTESFRQVIGGPTCTDDACANDSDISDLSVFCHDNSPFEFLLKTSRRSGGFLVRLRLLLGQTRL